jgi:hypothetical protein
VPKDGEEEGGDDRVKERAGLEVPDDEGLEGGEYGLFYEHSLNGVEMTVLFEAYTHWSKNTPQGKTKSIPVLDILVHVGKIVVVESIWKVASMLSRMFRFGLVRALE